MRRGVIPVFPPLPPNPPPRGPPHRYHGLSSDNSNARIPLAGFCFEDVGLFRQTVDGVNTQFVMTFGDDEDGDTYSDSGGSETLADGGDGDSETDMDVHLDEVRDLLDRLYKIST